MFVLCLSLSEGDYGEFGEYDEYYSSVSQDDEDIYEDLCSIQKRGLMQIPVVPSVPMEKRDYCIKELVETEKNYIEALNMIIRHFMHPLKSVIKPEDRKIIFIHIKDLAKIHTEFHSELYKACTSSQYKISECFLHWKEKFIIYGDYCSNLPHSQELIDELCNKSELVNQTVLRCQLEANDGKFKLRDLLSVPMQRVLKYHLLLKELLRNTPKIHDDYLGLEKALDAMLDLAQYINEVKRDNETLQIISDIQASITDLNMPLNTELKDYGRLLKDGELKIRSHNDNRLKNRYIFVFDKVMLMCKSTRGEQYSYKEALVLNDYKIEDVTNTKSTSKDKWTHYWYLVHRQNKTAYTMYAKIEEMKHKWIEAIQKALDNVCPESLRHTDHQFVLHSFDKPVTCAECEKLLRGIFYQGYHCSVCGIGVHKGCIETVRSCGAPSLPPRPMLLPGGSLTSTSSLSSEDSHSLMNGHRSIKVTAKWPYSGGPGYISFEPDDIIYVIRKISPTWWEGRVQRTGEEGLFPVDHVDETDPKRSSYEDPYPTWKSNPTPPHINPHEGYVNLNLEEYPWFSGTMDRDTATAKIEKLPTGTFLLRISPKQNGAYVISLNYDNNVKHMKVYTRDGGQLYYLSESKYFKSVVELIKWYEENSLADSFHGLNSKLSYPFKMIASNNIEPLGYATAIYNFSPETPNMLALKKGDRVTILSKAGGKKGWWKGQIGERIGYFPLTYVTEISD